MSALILLAAGWSDAANGVWNGTQSAYWTNSANWSAAPYPSGTSETASFTNAGNGQTVINLSGLSNIKYITFDSPAAAAYTIGTGVTNSQSLVMNDSGEFKVAAAAGNSQTFNCGVQLGADRSAQSYSFRNDSSSTLTFNNIFCPSSGGTAGGKTLNVNGSGPVAILGNITTNGATSFTLTDNNSGTLVLAGSNTFNTLNINGGANSVVDIGAGFLFLNNLGSTVLVTTQGATINGTGTIRLSTNTGTNYGDVKPAAGKTLVINPPIYSDGGFELNDAGTAVLNGTNTFLGDVIYTVNNGTISVGVIGNRGSATSNLGKGTKIIESSSPITGCRLLYTGPGETSDRIFEFSGHFTVEHGGTGKLLFTAPPSVLANAKTLTLQGSTAGVGEFSGAISNGTGTTSLTKNGAGTWILSGSNTYAGATTVNGGTLLVNSPGATAAGAVFVNMSAALGGSGTVNGAVTVANGGMLTPGGINAFGTLTLGSTLALTNSVLFFDVDAMNVSSDKLAVAGAVTLAGTNTIYLSFPGGVAPVGTNTLMTFASLGGTGSFALASGYGSAYLITTPTSVSLAVTNTGTYGLTWTGAESGAWDGTALNWTNGSAAVAYTEGDAVLFDDSTLNFSVSSAGPVAPASVTFNNSTNDYTVAADIGGTAPLFKLGAAAATLSGDNTFTGPISIGGGTLKVNGAGVLGGGNYAGSIANAGNLEYASSAAQTNSGVISGQGGLTVSGNGVLTLAANNTYSGPTVLNGSGTLILSGTNTCAGAITVFAGTLKARSPNALGGTGSGTTVSNATLELAGGLTFAAEPLTLAGTLSSQIGTNTFAGVITPQPAAVIDVGPASLLVVSASTASSGYGFTKTGSGTLRFTGDPNQTGPFVISAGTIELQHGGSTDASFIIAPGTTLREITSGDLGDYSITNNGTLDLRASDTVGTLVGSGLVTIGAGGAYTFGIGNDSKSGVFSGTIENGQGTLSLSKSGTGIATLTGVNTYTGVTVLNSNGGTLLVNSPGSLAASASVTVNSGATLGGSGTVNSPVTLAQGGALAAGGVGAIGTFTLSGTLAMNGGTLFCDISSAAGACDLVAVSGALTLTGANTVVLALPNGSAPVGDYTLMTFASRTGAGTVTLVGNNPNATLELGETSLVLHIANSSLSALTWNGNLSATWDGGNLNWKNGDAAASFTAGSAVTFDDTATGPYVGTISSGAAVTPGSVLFNSYLNSYTLSANIAGTAPLVKLAPMTATLSGTTTYNPTSVTVNAGTLTLSSAAQLSSGSYAGSIAINNGSFNPASSAAQTFSGTLSGAGNLNKSGTGPLILTGSNTFSGGATVSAGILFGKGSAAAFGTGALSLKGGTLELDGDNGLAFNNAATETANMAVKPGRLTAGPGVTHTLGALTIYNYTLTMSTGTAVNVNTPYGLTFGATYVSNSVFDVANNGTGAGTLTLGALSGNFNFTKQGAGTLTLGTSSSRSAGTATVTAGTLKLSHVSGLGTTNALIQLNGGVLDAAADASVTAHITAVGGNAAILSDRATAGSVGITHTLGTLNIGAFTLSVTNGPNVRLHSPYGLTFGTTAVSNSVFDVAANGSGLGTLTLGAVSGNFSMTKRGGGALRLVGVNAHGGATTNSNGKLVVVTGGSSSNSTVTLLASGLADAAPALCVFCAATNTQWTCTNLVSAAPAAPAAAVPALEFAFGVLPSTNLAPLRVLNSVTFGTNPVVNVYLGNLAVPTNSYPLMTVGVTAPTAVPALNISGGYTNSSLYWSGNTLMLKLSGSALPLKWSPGATGSGTWDVNNSANMVWTNGVAATFYQELAPAGALGDSVLFDDTTLAADSAVTLNTFASPSALTVSNILYGYTFTGAGAIAGSAGLTKYGTNQLTLATANAYTGATLVVAGTVAVPAGGGINVGNVANAGLVTVASASGKAVLNIAGGTVNATKSSVPALQVGAASGAVGAINLTDGVLYTGSELFLGAGGSGQNGFGALNVTGGSVTSASYLAIGRATAATGSNRGELLVSGGAVTVNANNIEIGSYQNSAANTCVATLTGGTTTLASGAGDLIVGNNQNGILNVSGSAAVSVLNTGKALKLGGASGITGIANLNGGVVTVPGVTQTAGATGYLNFNGGTLKANKNNAAFMSGLTAARIYAGGAVIDDGGYAIAIAQPLRSPNTGNGVSLAGMTFSGSGFIAPPIIDIAGYGNGASAVATIDDSGNLTGVTLTSPGVNYHMGTPTLTFTGGGGTVTQTGSASTVPNTSGGLTKVGAGTLTLTGTNTYSGATLVNSGRLVLAAGASCSNSAVTVQSVGTNAIFGVRYAGASALQAIIGALTTEAGLGGGGTPALEFAFSDAPSATTAPLAVAGDAAFAATPDVRVILTGLAIPNGAYPLMTVGGTAPAAVPALTLAGGYIGSTLSWSGNTLTLNLAGSASAIKWGTGAAGSGTWNVSDSSNLIWKDAAAAPAYYQETPGSASDQVIFDDAFITLNTTVSLNTTVTPFGVTANNSAFAYTVSGSGAIAGTNALVKSGAANFRLTTANTYSGGTLVNAGGVLQVSSAGGLGTGGVTNNGTLNLDANAGTATDALYTGLNNSLAGAGTNNVFLGTGSARMQLLGNYAGFVGVWNIGVGAYAGASRAEMTGLDNAAATINVLTNATLWVSAAGTHNAAVNLHGGDTGESYGQLRIDSGVWAGPVVLCGPITGSGDGFFGSQTANGEIAGTISEVNGPYVVSKVGAFTNTFSGANTYLGPTAVMAGGLRVPALGNVNGGPSPLGAPTTPAQGAIKLGSGGTAGTLVYCGNGETSDRVIDLAGTTGGAAIDHSGTNLLRLTGGLTYSGVGAKTLTFQGSTLGTGEFTGVISNTPYGNAVSVVKTGTGAWTLSSANPYTGGTTIKGGGTLIAADPNALGTNLILFANEVGGIDLAHDGVGEYTNEIFAQVSSVVTIKSNRSSPGEGINHNIGVMHLSGVTVYVTNGENVVSGKATVTTDYVDLYAGSAQTTILAPTTADLIVKGGASILGSSFLKTLQLDGTSLGSAVFGPVANGLNTISLTKANTGTWTLYGSNTFTGATAINKGTLVLAGTNGALAATSGITLSGNAVLELRNGELTNSTDRLRDAAGIAMSGGTLRFAHAGGGADYSERLGALSIAASSNTFATSLADGGRTSVVTIASLSNTAGGTLDFTGEGLGASERNRIFITGLADGPIGPWATVNGTNLAAYSSALGVHVLGSSDTDSITNLAARGNVANSVVPDSPTTLAQITEPGDSGPITLEGSWTNRLFMLSQNNPVGAVVDTVSYTTNKTLLAATLAIAPDQGSLTIGVAPGNGYVAPLAAGGVLRLENDSTNALLTLNAAVVNNTSSSTVSKFGAGTAVLAGSNTVSGAMTVNEGTLEFGGPFLQRLSNVIGGAGALAKSGTNQLHILAANTYSGPTYIRDGIVRANDNATFGTTNSPVYISNSATLNVGCTPDVGGTRTYNGISFGNKQFIVSGAGYQGMGAIYNSSTAMQYNAFSRIALAGDATFGGTQRWDMNNNVPASLDLNDYTLSKTGTSEVALHNVQINPGAAGKVVINQGLLRFETGSFVNGTSNNTVTVNRGGTLDLWQLNSGSPSLWSVVLNEGAFFQGSGGQNVTNQNVWGGPVTLNGRAFISSGYAPSHLTLNGDVSGSGTLVKQGGATVTLWLYGTNNTYSGGTIISNGTLFARHAASLPGYNAGQLTVAPGATLAVQSGDGTVGWSVPQIQSLHDTSTFASNTAVLSINTGASDVTYPGNLTKTLALTKAGNSVLTLNGTNTFTGAVNVNGGTLTFAPSSTNVTGAITVSGGPTNTSLIIGGVTTIGTNTMHTVYIASANGDRSTATLSANATFGKLFLGSVSGASGAFVQNSGNLAVGPTIGSTDVLDVGNGGYGYYRMNGGSLTTGQLGFTGAGGGTGVFDLFDGTVNVPTSNGWLIFNWGTGLSILNMFGGSLTAPPGANDTTLSYSGNSANLSVLNMLGAGTILDTTPTGRMLNMAKTAGSFLAAVNLNSGTIQANKVYAGVTGTPTVFGFNGGTLRAATSSTTFMQGLTAALVYPGGAVIDSSNAAITVAQSLLAPTGYGVTYIPVLTGGTNYIGAPAVKITGGSGLGATAIATVDLDEGSPTKGQVTGITVTSSGTGYQWYDLPVATLVGGGATAAATVGPCYLTPNANVGGLTKTGSGTLTLAGTNTYGGTTVISNGTLRIGLASAMPTNSDVVVAGGSYNLGGLGGVITNRSVILLSGSLSNGTLNASLTKTGTGAASLSAAQGSAQPLVVSGGTLTLTPVRRSQTAGLFEGRSTVSSFDLTSPNPMTAVKLSVTNAFLSFASSAASGGVWVDNSTYIYSGYVWNNNATNENWTFNKYFDDSGLVKLDGNVIINDSLWSNNVIATVTVAPGPHAIEVRLGQGSGGVGPYSGSYPGIGVDRLGRNTRTGSYFQRLADPGDGSFLTLSAFSGSSLLNTNAAVTVDAGATLDLGGTTQAVAQVSGSGTVSNGTLAVSGTIAPGGTNVIGTLTLASAAVTSGTLLADVDAGGNSDCLAVRGDIDLSGLSLQIAHPDQLDRHKAYTVVTCTGSRTGTFAAHNLPDRWHILYRADGTVRLVYVSGTVMWLR